MTTEELKLLRRMLTRAEQEAQPGPQPEPPPVIAVGDVVQIRPLSCSTFGGMLLYVAKTEPHQLRGFLLRPHRGGCREAWSKWHYADVERIGQTSWPDPEFARRRWCFEEGKCPVTGR